ncbi:hypothetical protein BDN71DRAFT_1043351 [Pleurotus eryngii]|uniref:Uncharacterized protein n=1 Tax=Pleurotus eryngii TaxID=5323 RepID=A0A9P6A608_PLEER|nr:hypothetical protein BDN71DRAFT_1043351 [Pleurotus eryngii]
MLDKGFLFNILDTETIRKTYNLIYRLSKACGIFPSSLTVEYVVDLETLKGGGGFLKGYYRHEAHKAVCREALLWKRVQHKYVLPFLGIDGTMLPPSMSPFPVIDRWNHQGIHDREQGFLPEAAYTRNRGRAGTSLWPRYQRRRPTRGKHPRRFRLARSNCRLWVGGTQAYMSKGYIKGLY